MTSQQTAASHHPMVGAGRVASIALAFRPAQQRILRRVMPCSSIKSCASSCGLPVCREGLLAIPGPGRQTCRAGAAIHTVLSGLITARTSGTNVPW